jgi:hypothetical protein
LGFGQVKFVDFGIAAEGATNKWQVRFEQAVFGKTLIEFSKYFMPGFVFAESSVDELLWDATLTII